MDNPRLRDDGTPFSPLAWPGVNPDAQVIAAVRGVLDVTTIQRTPPNRGNGNGQASTFRGPPPGALALRGRLRLPSEQAYSLLTERLEPFGYVPLFRRQGGDDVVIAAPGKLPAARTRYGVAIALFAATFASVLWVGALNEQGDGPINLLAGLPFAVSLMAILLAHEMGHFLMARRLGVPASPPFFLPLPIPPLGTLGAVMQMKAPPRDRRALLRVAVAGPLAGLAVALPVLVIGLLLSTVQPSPPTGYLQEGNSILYAALKYAIFGRFLPSGGVDVFLHPIAWAGWVGLLVTGLNLIPAGQLDGGHVAYILFGERTNWLRWVIVGLLLALGALWQGWWLWAVLIFVFGQAHAVPLDDVTPLRPPERALAIAVLLIFVLVFMPAPMIVR